MNWRLTGLIAVLLAAVGASLLIRSPSEASAKKKRGANIVFVTGGSNQYWQKSVAGAKAAAEDEGVKLDVLMPEHAEDIEEQNRMLLRIDKDNVDGVAVSPLNAEQQTRILSRLSQNAFVVTFDSDAPLSSRMTFIGASNARAGAQAATLLKEAAPEGGKVAIVVPNLTKDNMVERKRGFEERLSAAPADRAARTPDKPDSGAEFELVKVIIDNGDSAACKQGVLEVLSEQPDLVAIVGFNARSGPILVEALGEADRLKDVKIIAFDDDPKTLQGVKDGDIYATIVQDPYHYGFEAVRCLVALYNRPKEQLPVAGSLNIVPIATQAVRQSNLEEFLRLQEELAGGGE